MYRKAVILLLFILQLYIGGYAQNSYYIKDSSQIVGVAFIKGTDIENARICRIKQGMNEVTFTPNDISEYCTKKGRRYVVKEIIIGEKVDKVFLEVLSEGQVKLFYFHDKHGKRFFIDGGNTELVELDNDETSEYFFKKIIGDKIASNNNIYEQLQLVRFHKKDIALIGERYNNNISKAFPHISFGGYAGLRSLKFRPSGKVSYPYLKESKYNYGSYPVVGLLLSIPMGEKGWVFTPELSVGSVAISNDQVFYESFTTINARFEAVEMPVLFQYEFQKNKLRPYFHFGSVFTFNLNKTTTIDRKYGNSSTGGEWGTDKAFVSDFIGGFAIGAGSLYEIKPKLGVFITVRYSQNISIPRIENLDYTQIQIAAGVKF